jgi:hypothetical protein
MKISTLDDLKSVSDYLRRVGAEARSLKSAVVKELKGKYWRDVAVIKLFKTGQVECSDAAYEPTDAERSAMAVELTSVEWPEIRPLKSLFNAPKMITEAPTENVFLFRNSQSEIIFVQVRLEKEGEKKYVPWTYWDDGLWRCCEPDGPLPLFNADKLAGASTVFLHEGAKAARRVQEMIEGGGRKSKDELARHPWGRDLEGAAHLGWVGGALSAARTDWSVINNSDIKRVYIVADNDFQGRAAVPSISEQLRVLTFMIQFTAEFPVGFDLGDPFPASMFGSGLKIYKGPSFRDCLHPATWATDLWQAPGARGRPTAILRESFKGMWSYVEEADVFVCTEMPEIIRPEAILNKMLASFSHVNDTTRLILKSYRGRNARMCYRPDHPGLMVTFRGSSAINLHVPTTIKPVAGDPKPFEEFMDYLFVNKDEQRQVMRWCATLIARPELRMGYGLLLISERQGVGKTTLGANILAPLVGNQNVGFPSELDIMSPFNDWVAHKRLAIISEIYSGSSWKAYHALKSVITDKDISVNQKYMRPYIIDNWCHVLASSNSMRALKMENDDRRWFYPEVTEVPWVQGKFSAFRLWLENGGLNIISHWAQNFGDYVQPGERAPMTERKREMIDGSRSDAQKEAAAIAEMVVEMEEPRSLLLKDVYQWCEARSSGKVFDTEYEIRRTLVEAGLKCWKERIKVSGRMQYVVMNDAMMEAAQRSDNPSALLRGHLILCSSFAKEEM